MCTLLSPSLLPLLATLFEPMLAQRYFHRLSVGAGGSMVRLLLPCNSCCTVGNQQIQCKVVPVPAGHAASLCRPTLCQQACRWFKPCWLPAMPNDTGTPKFSTNKFSINKMQPALLMFILYQMSWHKQSWCISLSALMMHMIQAGMRASDIGRTD